MAADVMGDSTEFVGLAFDRLAPQGALRAIVARDPASRFEYVVTPNVDHVVRLLCSRSDLWPAYRHAWLTLCDSRILAKLAAHAAILLPVVTGSDLTEALFVTGMARHDRIAIVGGSDAVIGDLRDRYGFTRLLHYNPPMGFIHRPAERARAIDFVIDAQARYTFLAVGSPQQELLAYEIARTGLARGTGVCVGASLEFLAGVQPRAPQFLQRFALEWFYRLMTNPRRLWRRYLLDGPVIFSLFRRWRRFQRGRR